jgi:hypothetical protein
MSGPRDVPEEAEPLRESADGETQPEVEVVEGGSDPRGGLSEPPWSPGFVDEPGADAFLEPTPPPAADQVFSAPGEVHPVPRAPAGDDWVEADPAEGAAFGGGDGPFPVDLEGEAPRRANALWSALQGEAARIPGAPSPAGPRPVETRRGGADPLPPPEGALGARALGTQGQRAEEVRVERRRARPEKPPAAGASPPARSARVELPRRYPRMRALLSNPDLVPEGSAPLPAPRPPPVPGTFIPHPPPRPARAEPTDLDQMLALMADGLFIGESEAGATEIRVTLKDEFFAGTELRIALDAGEISATLLPPSREVYWQLGGEAGQLRLRLEERGLRVTRLDVVEPDA